MALLVPGLCYSICNAQQEYSMKVEALGCDDGSDAVRLRLLSTKKYVRVLEDGRADTSGGGGGFCHFKTEPHESGLVKFSRGPMILACEDDKLTSIRPPGVLGNSLAVSPAGLWEVAETEDQGTPPVKGVIVALCQGDLRFGPFIREEVSEGVLRFKASETQYLRMAPNGQILSNGGGGGQCHFKIQPEHDEHFRLCSRSDPKLCLGVTSWGTLTTRDVPSEKQMFFFEEVDLPDGKLSEPGSLTGTNSLEFDEAVDLTSEQYKRFVEDGFIIVRGVVPEAVTSAALAQINMELLQPGGVTKKDDGSVVTCQESATAFPVLELLYGTPLWSLAQRLAGRGKLQRLPFGQIALRPPDPKAVPLKDEELPGQQWHWDGMGNRDVKYSGFTLLVGVALSDQLQPNCGNLIVFPGSHQTLQPMIEKEVAEPGTYPWVDEGGAPSPGKPVLTGGQQILLGVGDAVILHQKAAHRIGINCSSNIRYQTYFRLTHVDHADHMKTGAVVNDLWAQYDMKPGTDEDDSESQTKKCRKY